MPRVKFTHHLKRFFPTLTETHVEATTVAEVVDALNRVYPGIADYVTDDQGSLRQHVNIFIGDSLIHDRKTLRDAVSDRDEISIFQALSGG